jgi:hypothetical protein
MLFVDLFLGKVRKSRHWPGIGGAYGLPVRTECLGILETVDRRCAPAFGIIDGVFAIGCGESAEADKRNDSYNETTLKQLAPKYRSKPNTKFQPR